MRDVDALVVGGGFYGAELALALQAKSRSVLLLEREPELLRRASFANQARVHGGYHYPRSLTTGLRSRANYAPFLKAHAGAVVGSFTNLYAISRRFSQVTPAQFRGFCGRVGAPLRPAASKWLGLFDGRWVDEIFEVEECAFDANRLREDVARRLREQGVEVRTGAEVQKIRSEDDRLRADWREDGRDESVRASHVLLCAYASTNRILRRSGLPLLPLRFELAELAVVRPPEPIGEVGITVMCGPFFSLMPHPGAGAHCLSHVRYTPHATWVEEDVNGEDPMTAPRRTRFESMRRDAARYVPLLADLRYTGSLWETKAVLPRNDADDGRPILFRQDHALRGLHCVLGGKIDNIFDMLGQLDRMEAEGVL